MAGGGVGTSLRVAQATIEEWAKKVSEETEKNLILLAMLKKKGRIKYGCSGPQFRWIVRKSDHVLNAFPDAAPISFSPTNTKTNAVLGWGAYHVQDTITLREKLEQGGPEAMVKIFSDREEVMRRGAMRGLAAEIFKDGNLAVNSALGTFHGIESFCNIGTQTDSDIEATTYSDTYAGLSTTVGALDSTNTRVWTPVVISTDYTPSGGSQQTWANYADEYIREGLSRATYGQSESDRPDLIMLNRDAYVRLLNLLDDKERIPVQRGAGLALTQLGFGNNVELDGCAITWDAAVPATDASPYLGGGTTSTVRGYMFTTGQMELRVLGEASDKSLFTARTTFNPTYRSDDIFMHLIGNFKFESPRHFGKFADLSAVA